MRLVMGTNRTLRPFPLTRTARPSRSAHRSRLTSPDLKPASHISTHHKSSSSSLAEDKNRLKSASGNQPRRTVTLLGTSRNQPFQVFPQVEYPPPLGLEILL